MHSGTVTGILLVEVFPLHLGEFLKGRWLDLIKCLSCPRGGLVESGEGRLHEVPKLLAAISHAQFGSILNPDVTGCWTILVHVT